MNKDDVVQLRLLNQQITQPNFKHPQEIVTWLGAMQSQEYAQAKWAIGLRLPGLTDEDVEKDFNSGKILRTHILRPTWHFVSPADIRWMQALTAPRVHAFSAYMYRKEELDTKLFKRCTDAFAKALEGGKHLTRAALQETLNAIKIKATGHRLAYIVMYAELEGVLCSGPREGKQFTYALLHERAPKAKLLPHDEALAELSDRYFRSRGPASAKDFAWWSGLTVKDAKAGMASLGKEFKQTTIDGETYAYCVPEKITKGAHDTFLMPDYDEYGIAYKDRSAIFREGKPDAKGRNNLIFSHVIVVDGIVAGTWKADIKKNTVTVETAFFNPLNKTQQTKVKQTLEEYAAFLQKTLA